MSSSPHYVPPEDAKIIITGPVTTIKPKAFSIVWGNDPRYWRQPASKEGDEHAELHQVSWLEVTCSATVQPGKRYSISFKITLKQEAFGWNGCPVFMMAKIGKKGKYSWKKIKPLDQLIGRENEIIPEDKFEMAVPDDCADTTLYFGLYEVWSGKWKGGLLIHEAVIREV